MPLLVPVWCHLNKVLCPLSTKTTRLQVVNIYFVFVLSVPLARVQTQAEDSGIPQTAFKRVPVSHFSHGFAAR